MTNLPPVSDAMRGLLSLLGETPAQHQAQILAKRKGAKAPAKRLPPTQSQLDRAARDLANRTYLERLDTERVTAATIVDRFQPENLVNEAYVLFQRNLVCRNCGRRDQALAHSQLFLRKRVRGQDTRVYFPTNEISEPTLRRVIEISNASIPVCLHCFEEAVCQVVESPPPPPTLESRPSPGADTESSASMYLAATSTLPLAQSSQSTPPSESTPTTALPTLDGSGTEPSATTDELTELVNTLNSQALFASTRSESEAQPASAEDTPSLTDSSRSFASF